jgi:hypothetical protein
MLIRLIKLRKAQSTAEYAILFALVIAAAVGMQTYMKRSIQAKMHDGALALTSVTGDITGDGVSLGTTAQYEPYYSRQSTSSTPNKKTTSNSTEEELEGGARTRTVNQTANATTTLTERTYTDYDVE